MVIVKAHPSISCAALVFLYLLPFPDTSAKSDSFLLNFAFAISEAYKKNSTNEHIPTMLPL